MKVFQKIHSYLTQRSRSYQDAADISPHTPQNYMIFLLGSFIAQLADALANTKTVLVWLMNSIGAPIFITGLLVPVRESGSMLPQVFMAGYISRLSRRLPVWMVGALIQAISLMVIGVITLISSAQWLGLIVLVCVALFSLGRSLCSVSSKDIMGRTIPKPQRGSLTGYSQTLSGVVVLAIGLWFQFGDISNQWLPWLVIVAGGIWLIAMGIYAYIVEPVAEVSSVSENSSLSMVEIIQVLRRDVTLRRFIIARGLLLCSALSTPFYITLAQEYIPDNIGLLGIVIVVTGIAGVVSSPLWGHMADWSSRRVMSSGGLVSAVLGFVVVGLLFIIPEVGSAIWFYAVVILIVTVAHNGVRIGRKTYIINAAQGNQRIAYVSISNSVIGLLLLFVGVVTSLFSLISISAALLALSIMGVVGAYLSYRLPHTESIKK